jgi:hypothetical protein
MKRCASRLTPDSGCGTLATAVAGKYLDFCWRLAAIWRRAAAWRGRVQRVFAHLPCATHIHSSVYAPLFATTVMPAARLELTLAAGIRLDVRSIATAVPHAPRMPLRIQSPARLLAASCPLRCASTVLRVAEPARHRSASHSAVPAGRLQALLEVVERPRPAQVRVLTHAVANVRRDEPRRLETIVRQPPAPVIPATTEPKPANPQHAEGRAPSPWTARPKTTPALAGIPDADVARLTERVVQQINRRILAERERLGR